MTFIKGLVSAIKTGFSTAFTVCGFLIFFGVLIAFFRQWHLLDGATILLTWVGCSENTALGLLSGLLEMTSVVQFFGNVPLSPGLLSVLGLLLGWGGICVYFQVVALCGSRPISMQYYVVGKLGQGCLGAILTPLLYHYPLATILIFFAALWIFRKKPLAKSAGIRYTIEKGGLAHVIPKKD